MVEITILKGCTESMEYLVKFSKKEAEDKPDMSDWDEPEVGMTLIEKQIVPEKVLAKKDE